MPRGIAAEDSRGAALVLCAAGCGRTGGPGPRHPVALGAEHCVVNVRAEDRLNLREGPGTGFAIIGGLDQGRCGVMVAACAGNWCAVEDGHYTGHVHRHFIAMVSPARHCVTGVARNDRLNLRAFPSSRSSVLTSLAPNACGIAYLPYARDGWQKVRVAGWEGWVVARYLTGL